jgi:hypothetical protein
MDNREKSCHRRRGAHEKRVVLRVRLDRPDRQNNRGLARPVGRCRTAQLFIAAGTSFDIWRMDLWPESSQSILRSALGGQASTTDEPGSRSAQRDGRPRIWFAVLTAKRHSDSADPCPGTVRWFLMAARCDSRRAATWTSSLSPAAGGSPTEKNQGEAATSRSPTRQWIYFASDRGGRPGSNSPADGSKRSGGGPAALPVFAAGRRWIYH